MFICVWIVLVSIKWRKVNLKTNLYGGKISSPKGRFLNPFKSLKKGRNVWKKLRFRNNKIVIQGLVMVGISGTKSGLCWQWLWGCVVSVNLMLSKLSHGTTWERLTFISHLLFHTSGCLALPTLWNIWSKNHHVPSHRVAAVHWSPLTLWWVLLNVFITQDLCSQIIYVYS